MNLNIKNSFLELNQKEKLSSTSGSTSTNKLNLSFIISKFSKLLNILKTKSVLSFVEYLKG
jgi:hypothetical protein